MYQLFMHGVILWHAQADTNWNVKLACVLDRQTGLCVPSSKLLYSGTLNKAAAHVYASNSKLHISISPFPSSLTLVGAPFLPVLRYFSAHK